MLEPKMISFNEELDTKMELMPLSHYIKHGQHFFIACGYALLLHVVQLETLKGNGAIVL